MCTTDQPLLTPEPPKTESSSAENGQIEISPEETLAENLAEFCEEVGLPTPEPPKTESSSAENGQIEISPEETQELVKSLTEFCEDAGFNETLQQTAHIMLLCLYSNRPLNPDLAQLCELVGCSPEFATEILERAKKYEIFQGFNWPNENGEIDFMMDVMVVGGILQRRTNDNSELEYRLDPDRGFYVDDHVKHKSGFGSGWYIAAEKRGEDGQQLVRLKQSHAPVRGGQWRDASDYIQG